MKAVRLIIADGVPHEGVKFLRVAGEFDEWVQPTFDAGNVDRTTPSRTREALKSIREVAVKTVALKAVSVIFSPYRQRACFSIRSMPPSRGGFRLRRRERICLVCLWWSVFEAGPAPVPEVVPGPVMTKPGAARIGSREDGGDSRRVR